jgi:hypothetical protein
LKRKGERKHSLEGKCLNNFISFEKNSNLPRHKERGVASNREFFFLSYCDEIVPRARAARAAFSLRRFSAFGKVAH